MYTADDIRQAYDRAGIDIPSEVAEILDSWDDPDNSIEVQLECDRPFVIGYEDGHEELVIAASFDEAREVAEDSILRYCNYDMSDGTVWVDYWITDLFSGERIDGTVAVHPDEPDCDEAYHDWQAPEWFGGCKENPGVWEHGGGVECTRVCRNCGVYRVSDSWARRPGTGQEGLYSVRYEDPDSHSLALVIRCRLEDMRDDTEPEYRRRFDEAVERVFGCPIWDIDHEVVERLEIEDMSDVEDVLDRVMETEKSV